MTYRIEMCVLGVTIRVAQFYRNHNKVIYGILLFVLFPYSTILSPYTIRLHLSWLQLKFGSWIQFFFYSFDLDAFVYWFYSIFFCVHVVYLLYSLWHFPQIFYIGHSSNTGLHGKRPPTKMKWNMTSNHISYDWEIKWNSQEFQTILYNIDVAIFTRRKKKNKQQIIQTYQFPLDQSLVLKKKKNKKRNKNKQSYRREQVEKSPFFVGGWRRPKAKLTLLRLWP